MRNHHYVLMLGVVLCCLSPARLVAQDETPTRVTDQNRTGELPFSTSVGTAVEHVDVATAALNVKIPIVSVPGRGVSSEVYIRFNSNFLVAAPRLDIGGNGYYTWWPELYSGWQLNHPNMTKTIVTVHCSNLPSNYNATYWENWIYSDSDGGKHPIAQQTAFGQCAGPGDAQGPDLTGEGMWSSGNYNALSADGLRSPPNTGSLEDSYGIKETMARHVGQGDCIPARAR